MNIAIASTQIRRSIRPAPLTAAACELAATILTPATLNCASNTGIAIPRNTGKRKPDPADARKAFGDQGSALPRVLTTPVAPNASADRTIVPTFPGSCTAAITTTSTASPRNAPSTPAAPRTTSSNSHAWLREKRRHSLRRLRPRHRRKQFISSPHHPRTRNPGLTLSSRAQNPLQFRRFPGFAHQKRLGTQPRTQRILHQFRPLDAYRLALKPAPSRAMPPRNIFSHLFSRLVIVSSLKCDATPPA